MYEQPMRTIYLDLDGVVADFVSRCLTCLEHLRPSGSPPLSADQVDRWDIETLMGISLDTFWKGIANEEFWVGIQAYSWAQNLLRGLENVGHVVILSSPGACPVAAAGKMRWLARTPGFSGLELVLTQHKHHLAGAGKILIDDSEKNCKAWEDHGGHAILFPQYWNRERTRFRDPWFDPVAWCVGQVQRAPISPITHLASHFGLVLAGYELDQEAVGEPVNQDAVVHAFSGNGASSMLRVKDVYAFLRTCGQSSTDHQPAG